MAEERDQVARWTEPTSIEGADTTPEEGRCAQPAFRAWRRYWAIGERTELVELGMTARPLRSVLMSGFLVKLEHLRFPTSVGMAP